VIAQPNNTVNGLLPNYCQSKLIFPLTATIANGAWQGDVDPLTGEFSPVKLGLNTIQYAVDVKGCKDTATLSTTVHEIPQVSLGNDTSICTGSSFVKNIVTQGAAVLWSTNVEDSFITVSTANLYWVQLSKNGCSARDSFTVTTISAPNIELGGDSLLCGDGQMICDVRAPEATYTWSDGYAGGGLRTITQTGDYSVLVVNKCGSSSDDISLVFLDYACEIFIPNAFSPNSDALNEVFGPSGNVTILGMEVYSVWGEKLYEAKDGIFGWDGNYNGAPAPAGRYYFIIRYSAPVEGKETPQTESGDFYLMR
jgi:gliding motility-associated-like protein